MKEYTHEFKVNFFKGLIVRTTFLFVQNEKRSYLVPGFINFFFNILESIDKSLRERIILKLFETITNLCIKHGNRAARERGIKILIYLMSRPEVDSESIARCLLEINFAGAALLAKKTILSLTCRDDLELAMKGAKNEKEANILKKIFESEQYIPRHRSEAIIHYFCSAKLEGKEREVEKDKTSSSTTPSTKRFSKDDVVLGLPVRNSIDLSKILDD